LVFGPQMGSNSESLMRDSKKKEPCQEGPRDVEKVDPQRPESFPRASKARDSIQPPPSKKKKKKRITAVIPKSFHEAAVNPKGKEST
jgi:hypothetical protein